MGNDNTGYIQGDGCTCGAYHSGECCCDVDWTDPEIYHLRGDVKRLKDTIKNMHRHAVDNGVNSHYYYEMVLKALDVSRGTG